MSSEGTVMIFTLLGLPLLLTILAFFVMGRLSEEKPRPRPTPAPPRSMPPSAQPSRPNTSLRPGTSYGAGFPVESAPPTLPVLASLSRNTLPQLPFPQEDSRQSPLTMALFVKNPQGVAVRFDGVLSAAPENRTVNVVRVKDSSVILSARVAENRDACNIHLVVPAKDGKAEPIAMLDTKDAVLWPGANQGLRRQVALHRVDAYGPHEEPCAWIVPGGPGTFFVFYSSVDSVRRSEPAMTVFAKGSEVDRITDAQGSIIAASEATAAAVAPGHCSGLWVKEGTDMALITCVALAVQKLGAPWTSRMLVGRSSRAPCGPC